MKDVFICLLLCILSLAALAQDMDTLSNLPQNASLTVYEYEEVGWGYYTGHNNLYREEFAEKYYISGSAKVVGVISHHTGTNTNENLAEFNVYDVGINKLPGTILGTQVIPYKDIDLSGEAMLTFFDTAVAVVDSFYISFNLNDYAHGGYSGDTLALMTGEDGSRTEEDIALFGRNAIRYHNHDTRLWRDFYTQNFTPIATHFALFPIVEIGGAVTSIEDGFITNNELTLYPGYPNPASEVFTLKFAQHKTAKVLVQIYDTSGKLMLNKNLGQQPRGEYTESIGIDDFPDGTYIYTIQSGMRKLAGRLLVE